QHLEDRYEELLAGGATDEEAYHAALAELREGDSLAHELALVEAKAPSEPSTIGGRRASMIGGAWQDIRSSIRMLRKNPGFTVVAVLTLALGIGANTAIFSVINGVLLNPLPYKEPEKIMTVWQDNTTQAIQEDVSPANFLDYKELNQVFEGMAAAEPYGHDLLGAGDPEAISSWLVSEEFFRLLGVNALHGRTFLPEEFHEGSDHVVVLGYRLWQRRFGSDPNMIGQKIILDGEPHVVAGVMPPEFQMPPGKEMWAPRVSGEIDRRRRGATYLKVIARLKPGVTVEQARSEMKLIASGLADQYPQTNAEMSASVVPLSEQMVGHLRPALLVLFGAVGFVLLIACANVANLLLVRGAEREQEFAIRAALGAGRARLMRQLGTEGLVLALAGGAGGVLLAGWAVSVMSALNPGNFPRFEQVALDGRVLGFAVGVSMLTSLIFGLFPALQFSTPDLNRSLKESGRTGTAGLARHRLRSLLVVSEIAFALVLLAGAGLLIRSFVGLLRVDPGFRTDKVLSLEVHVWGKQRTPQQRKAFFEQSLEKISALPGVQAAGAVSALPFHENSIDVNISFTVEGRAAPVPGQEPSARMTISTLDYFKALGIPLLQGRSFNSFDNEGSTPVVLVNDKMARAYWPNEDPVGKKITVRYGQPTVREIIGVVGDVRHTGLDSEPQPELFIPHAQSPSGSMTYVVRTDGEPSLMLPVIKKQIWALDKDLPFNTSGPIEQLVSASLGEREFHLVLLASFAALALALAALGIYGLMSFSTSQRTHEIGIRMALGATPEDIVRMIVGQGAVLAAGGVALGIAGAALLMRFLESMLYGVSPTDPATLCAAALLLGAVTLLACYIPARRATRIGPLAALG
ncbi:MAG TPA: ABC transporter permease, partial [Blastocatellia bacterium]|nr:ABC transporter permease [Blastocatellia bacterium]